MTWLLALLLAARPYHVVPLADVATTVHTHVDTCGLVVYRRLMQDGDWHLTLQLGAAKLVAELIPALQLEPPRKGQWVRVRGITRFDKAHGWQEVHPVEAWNVAPDRCAGGAGGAPGLAKQQVEQVFPRLAPRAPRARLHD